MTLRRSKTSYTKNPVQIDLLQSEPLITSQHKIHQAKILFKLKAQHQLLSTLSFLPITQPHLYKADLLCPICNDCAETWFHLYTCTLQKNSIQDCVELTIDFIVTSVKEYTCTFDQSDFEQELRALPMWSIPSSNSMNINNRSDTKKETIILIVLKLPQILLTNTLEGREWCY